MAKQDATAAVTGFRTWLHDGPAAGLGRQHRYTRTSTGWLPSTLLSSNAAEDDDYSKECDDLADPSDGEAQLAGIAEAMAPSACARPASLQEEAENEALMWGAQWLCGAEYDMSWPSDLGDALPPLDEKRLIGAMRSFPAGTGLGWDRMHPRAWLRFGSAALHSLLHLFMLVEREGRWPDAIGHVIIVLLAKATGGFRPIGLFPSMVRVWMRIRLADAVVWQSLHDRSWLYASAGKGADVAAWKQAARSEQAAARDWQYAAILLDLVKAFERVPHDVLIRQAAALGYNLHLLRVSLAGYRLPRTLLVQGGLFQACHCYAWHYSWGRPCRGGAPRSPC